MGTIKTTNIEPIADNGTVTLGSSGDQFTLATGAKSSFLYPAFEAYLSADQSISSNTNTKVEIDTEVFDTDNCYDNSTNYRFTPTVAGKYYVYADIQHYGSGDLEAARTKIYKNGTEYRNTAIDPVNASNAINASNLSINTIIDMNGSSDYLELFGLIQSGAGQLFRGGSPGVKSTYFGAYRIGS